MAFASHVSKLVCVEPGSNLVERLRRNLSIHDNVEILNSDFEDAQLSVASFDLIFAAQSFHWIDSTVRYQKSFEILKPGGWLAAFWKRWIPSGEERSSAVTMLFQEYLQDYTPLTPQQHEMDALSDLFEMVESELFSRCQLRRYPSPQGIDRQTPEECAKSLRTWSAVAALEKKRLDELISRLVEVIRLEPQWASNDETTLIIGQKRG